LNFSLAFSCQAREKHFILSTTLPQASSHDLTAHTLKLALLSLTDNLKEH